MRKYVCSFEPLFFSNKYAQHIYCLYLGKIDGIAGEQNIYHFCLWLIVVLGMAALRRQRDEREKEMKWGMRGRGKKGGKTAVEKEYKMKENENNSSAQGSETVKEKSELWMFPVVLQLCVQRSLWIKLVKMVESVLVKWSVSHHKELYLSLLKIHSSLFFVSSAPNWPSILFWHSH